MAKTRITNPRQLPVQLNVSLPWSFREHIINVAEHRGMSMNSMVVDALYAAFDNDEYRRNEARAAREETKNAGATS